MSQNTSAATKVWTRPEAQRLGRIRNVAGKVGSNVINGTNTDRT